MYNQDVFVDLIQRKLKENTDSISEQWNNPVGTATKHFVVDDLLPIDACTAICEAFPRDGVGFFFLNTFRERKRTSANLSALDPILTDITYAFQRQEIVDLVSNIVDFAKIESDPKLYAGGLSMMFEGDFLNPHIDNSHDSSRGKYRRLNLLYYVSPDWTLDRGGNFELWNDDRTTPKTIVSRFNRLVVMETNKTSWHSVSPMKTNHPRRCVSNYYFSKASPDSTEYFHVTSFSGRPKETIRRGVGIIDNFLRNALSKGLKFGRGKHRINKTQS